MFEIGKLYKASKLCCRQYGANGTITWYGKNEQNCTLSKDAIMTCVDLHNNNFVFMTDNNFILITNDKYWYDYLEEVENDDSITNW